MVGVRPGKTVGSSADGVDVISQAVVENNVPTNINNPINRLHFIDGLLLARKCGKSGE
jgi:hypothetical protein